MHLKALCKNLPWARPITKTLLIMKFTAIFLFYLCLHAGAKGFSQKISLSQKNVPLEKIFKIIEKKTGYLFWYEYSVVKNAPVVSVEAKNKSIPEILDDCFKDLPLTYTLLHKTFLIRPKPKKEEILLPVPIEVSGRVTDNEGKPLAGVSIIIVGGSGGVSTDEQGRYRISVSENDVLQFSYVGFEARQISVQNRKVIDVSLSPATRAMNDIVVVGYGTQQRSNVTGAIASVSAKDFEKQPISGLDQAIAGQAAGVQVAQRTGTPGGGVTIRVRGTGSISAGNEPLYVIDGFPFEGGYSRDYNPLSTINPSDIESIQILKDAASASIYGSRGSNGVVLITTKRGKTGRASIQLNAYYGVQEAANKIDMLNAREYAIFNTEARNNAWVDAGGKATDPNSVRPDRFKIPPMFSDPESLGKGTDWQDAVFRSAPIQNYQLTVSGGTDAVQYLVSGGYFNQKGIVIHTGFERYSMRINLDAKVTSKIKLGINFAPSYSKNDVLPVEDQVFSGGILGSALSMPPTVPVYNPDGSFTSLLTTSPYNIGIIDNPVAIATKIKGGATSIRSLSTVFGEWEILKDLKFKSSLGLSYYDARTDYFSPSTLGRAGVAAPVTPIGNASMGRDITWLNENTLTYDRIIKEDHHLNALAGYTAQKSRFDYASLNAINFPNDLVTTLNAGQISSGGTSISQWSLLSYLGRINYDYKAKYLLSATVRRDGSSRFGADNRWGVFPSASAGWNISKEKFFDNIRTVSNLKLRLSYGWAGNNSIGNYNAIGLLSANRYVFGAGLGSILNGLRPSSISNNALGWEVMKQANAGIDIGLFQNRLSFIIDYYQKTTSDLLLNVPVPGSTGFSTALQNIGEISNKGWEFSFSSKNFVNAFKWSTDFNISFDRNRVVALGPSGDPIISTSPSFSPQTHITKIGEPLGSFYGYKVIGVYKDQSDVDKSAKVPGAAGSRPGDLKLQDTNGDGTITALDYTIIGKNQPDFTYGFSNQFSYKGFSLSILVDGAQGVDVLNGSRRNIGLVNGSYSRRDVLGRWQSPENPGDGRTPRANTAATGGNVSLVSSLLIEDASFTRIRNINLGYQLPSAALRYLHARQLSVYFSVQNAYTFTDYKGYNPEQSLNGASPLTPGVDFNGYPVARAYTFGLNLGF